MNSGVYLIMVGADTYVGSTTDLAERYKAHIWKLKCNRHPNRNLQAAWDAHGVLSFQVLHFVEVDDLITAEQRWLDALLPTLNICKYAGSLGRLGQKMPLEARQKLSTAMKGKVAWNKGATLDAEHKARIAASMSGVHRGNKFCAGRHITPATRAKISASLRSAAARRPEAHE